MTSLFNHGILGLAAAATVATLAAPAEARRWRGDDDDEWAYAIGGGIIGLGLGAAIASNRGRYYDRGYYPRRHYSYGYGHRRCHTRRVWDPYYGRRVRVRYCDRY